MLQEKHKDILYNHVEKWNKVKELIGKYFDAKVIHNVKNISTKIRFS